MKKLKGVKDAKGQISTHRGTPSSILTYRECVQRILVLELSSRENTLLITPLLSTLRLHYPNALIDVLLYQEAESLLAANKDVYLIYTIDRHLKQAGIKKRWQEEKALWNSLSTWRYDLMINLSDQWRAALYCRRLKPTFSLGFDFSYCCNWLWKTCHSRLVSANNHHKPHDVSDYLNILTPLQLPYHLTELTAAYSQTDSDNLSWLTEGVSLAGCIVIQPVSRYAFKSWSSEPLIQTINYLIESGEIVVLISERSPERNLLIKSIRNRCISSPRLINLSNQLELSEITALIAQAKLFLGVNSVSMIIANALKIPSVLLQETNNLENIIDSI